MKDESHSVLIIEDEKGISDTVAYALKTEGFRALVASTGRQAIKVLEKEPVGLVILDVGLPDISGFDLFHQIRKTSKVPVIFLTARAEETDRVAGLEMGGDDYVSKPFKPRELSARVRAVLRRVQGGKEEKIVASSTLDNPLRVDTEFLRATYHRTPLDLSRFEFLILKALAEKPGRVLSREKILDLVWGQAEGPLDRTVDAHIKSLRAKFRAVKGSKDPIKTHRSLGYSIRENL